jgi:hypothetical protein
MSNTKIAPGPEVWFRAIGTALAGASLAFAGYMLAYGGGKVRVNGIDHLAIFAQPRGPTTTGVTEIAASRGVEPLGASAALTDRGADAQPAPRPARIVAARPDRVWLMIGGVIRSASLNDDVPGIGRISAIVRRNDGWALLDDRETTLLTVANDANGAQLFSRKLIFE